MSITRSMGKQLNLQASLLHGKVQLVELALRTAAGQSGLLNISHRVPFEDLAKRPAGAVIAFVPQTPMEQAMYNEYVRYFGSKARAGVANLDNNDSLYIVPPVGEAAPLLTALEAAGAPAPLPRNCLLGIITAKPTAILAGAPPPALAAAVGSAPDTAGKPADEKAPPGAADSPEKMAAPVGADGEEKAAAADDKDDDDAEPAKDAKDDDDEGGGEMSGEALMNLFSNPDLIKSLQSMNEPGDD